MSWVAEGGGGGGQWEMRPCELAYSTNLDLQCGDYSSYSKRNELPSVLTQSGYSMWELLKLFKKPTARADRRFILQQ